MKYLLNKQTLTICPLKFGSKDLEAFMSIENYIFDTHIEATRFKNHLDVMPQIN